MPVYEYHCRKCGTTFELLRPMSRSTDLAKCPSGHPGAGRVVSVFAARTGGGDGFEEASLGGGGCGGCAGGACACGGH
ncbi:MAG: zinc ribbon domain-containing protein [Dehalococcoidia bacterium]